MPSASRPAFLRRLARVSARSRRPDWGDMGTALALEETLDEHPGPASAAAPGAPEPSVEPVSAWRLWLGRRLGA